MFRPLNSKPASARDAILGTLIGMVTCYVLYNLSNYLRGNFSLDLQAVRFLLCVGLLVMGFAAWETRRAG